MALLARPAPLRRVPPDAVSRAVLIGLALCGVTGVELSLWHDACSRAWQFDAPAICTASAGQSLLPLLLGVAIAAGLILGGLELVANGRPFLAVVPALAWAYGPALSHPTLLPAPLTLQPVTNGERPLVSLLELGLVLAPVLGAAWRAERRRRRWDRPAVASFALCAFTAWALVDVVATVDGVSSWLPYVVPAAPLFAVGYGLSDGDALRRLRAPLVAGLLLGVWIVPSAFEASTMQGLLYAGCAVAGLAWSPVASVVGRWLEHPHRLLTALNLLNGADALLTAAGLHSGALVELNPLVRWAGLPTKLAVVAGASILLYRWRSYMLLWPTAALAMVLVWHLQGLLLLMT